MKQFYKTVRIPQLNYCKIGILNLLILASKLKIWAIEEILKPAACELA